MDVNPKAKPRWGFGPTISIHRNINYSGVAMQKLELDINGELEANYIRKELHEVTAQNGLKTVLVPFRGAFFTKDLEVFLGDGETPLVPKVDFWALHTIPEAVELTGEEVCSFIALDSRFEGTTDVRVTYRAVGERFVNFYKAISSEIDKIKLDNSPVEWGSILGLPTEWRAAYHFHNANNDLYGLDFLIRAVYDLAEATRTGDNALKDQIMMQITSWREGILDRFGLLEDRFVQLDEQTTGYKVLIEPRNQTTSLPAGATEIELIEVSPYGLSTYISGKRLFSNDKEHGYTFRYEIDKTFLVFNKPFENDHEVNLVNNNLDPDSYNKEEGVYRADINDIINGIGDGYVSAKNFKLIVDALEKRLREENISDAEILNGRLQKDQVRIPLDRRNLAGMEVYVDGARIWPGTHADNYSIEMDETTNLPVVVLGTKPQYEYAWRIVFAETLAQLASDENNVGLVRKAGLAETLAGDSDAVVQVKYLDEAFNAFIGGDQQLLQTIQSLRDFMATNPDQLSTILNEISQKVNRSTVDKLAMELDHERRRNDIMQRDLESINRILMNGSLNEGNVFTAVDLVHMQNEWLVRFKEHELKSVFTDNKPTLIPAIPAYNPQAKIEDQFVVLRERQGLISGLFNTHIRHTFQTEGAVQDDVVISADDLSKTVVERLEILRYDHAKLVNALDFDINVSILN